MCDVFLLCVLRLTSGTTDKALEEQADRARKLQGGPLTFEDFAEFLRLPVTDSLSRVHHLFHQVRPWY